jgi:CHAT domain-containing protein
MAAFLLAAQSDPDRPGWPAAPRVKAFELLESVRSRVFLELFGELAEGAVTPELTELAEAEREALDAYRTALRSRPASPHIEHAAAADQTRAAKMRLDRARAGLVAAGPAGAQYAELRSGEPASYAEVRSLLDDCTLLAEYHVYNLFTLLFLLRRDHDEPEVRLIEIGRDDVRAAVAAFRADPRSAPGGWDSPLQPLVAPLAELCEEGELLCLVPHDALHLLPWHAIKIDDRPLNERNPLCYLPSASVLRYCRARSLERWQSPLSHPEPGDTVVMADSRADRPLVHGRHQAVAIGRLFGASARVLVGDEVTRAAVAEVSDQRLRVWHLACHGEFDELSPDRSGVLLASEPADPDPRLAVADLMRMRLDADLVTLSPCQTAVSARAPGDEMIGLTRAVLYAGAPRLLATLWEVDEISTSLLMQDFYTRWLSGTEPARALQEAQRRIRGMTRAEVIAACAKARTDLDEAEASDAVTAFTLEWDIANLRFQARDFAAAEVAYDELRAGFPPDSPQVQALTASMVRARRAARQPSLMNYDGRPYDHPYYWAPFVLVGDWR